MHLRLVAQRDGAEGRNDEESKQQRAEQRGDDRDGHRAEHPSFKTLQRQNWQVDGDDDQHAEVSRLSNDNGKGSVRIATLEPVHAVLNHDHGTVDDGPEVDRAKTH